MITNNFSFCGLGVVRVGEVDGEFVINPTWSQLIFSSLNLVVACSEKKIGEEFKFLIPMLHCHMPPNILVT